MLANAFETLRAPTNYNTRDIAQHIQLLDDVPGETKEQSRVRLLSPGERVFDELTTVRGGDYDATLSDADKKLYAHIVATISSTKILPISQEAAYEWFRSVKAGLNGENKPNKTTLKKKLTALAGDDPWIAQGAAAICTRCAMENELEKDTKHAATAWDAAMQWWQIFFTKAKVDSANSFAIQRDDKSKQLCGEAWDGFRAELVRGIKERCVGQYVDENRGAAINACLSALTKNSLRQIDSNAYEETFRNTELRIRTRLNNSHTVTEADSLWRGLPEAMRSSPAILSCMFSSMSDEVKTIETGYGKNDDIIAMWKDLDCEKLKNSTDPEIRAGLNKYYEAVSAAVRNTFGGESPDQKKMRAFEPLLRHLPSDYQVAKNPSNEPIKPEYFLGIVSMLVLDVVLMEIETCPKSEAKKRGKELWLKIKSVTPDEDIHGEVRRSAVTNTMLKLRERDDTEFTLEVLSEFPPDQTFNTNDFTDIGHFIAHTRINTLLMKLVEGSPTDSDAPNTLRELTELIRSEGHRDSEYEENYTTVLKNLLIGCVNVVMEDNDYGGRAKELGLSICDKLPQSTTFPSGDGVLTLDKIRELLTGGGGNKDIRRIAELISKLNDTSGYYGADDDVNELVLLGLSYSSHKFNESQNVGMVIHIVLHNLAMRTNDSNLERVALVGSNMFDKSSISDGGSSSGSGKGNLLTGLLAIIAGLIGAVIKFFPWLIEKVYDKITDITFSAGRTFRRKFSYKVGNLLEKILGCLLSVLAVLILPAICAVLIYLFKWTVPGWFRNLAMGYFVVSGALCLFSIIVFVKD